MTEKKPYEAPQLTSYGSVEKITETTSLLTGFDGGTGLNQYAS
ncbi:MAG: lasso RiPP family leader peptide-containing protein [Pseudomonadota bacterium]